MKRLCLSAAIVFGLAAAAWAHHSPAAFDLGAQVTLQGRISRLDWVNPHVYIYVDTATTSGDTVQWLIETDPTPILIRSGWSREMVDAGTMVTVRGNPDRDTRRNHALLVSMALPNGVVLTPRSAGARSATRATRVAGVWNGLRGFGQRRLGTFRPTAKGVAAMKTYSEALNPVTECVPVPSPMLPTLPYLNEIDIQSDRVVIRNEYFNVDRTVYMDGRGHPANGSRTIQGHSIGRWDNDVLVVDTTLFTEHRTGNAQGVGPTWGLPSGLQKHVVERYRLAEDGTRLSVDFVVEDPEYLEEPFTLTTEWDYSPQLRLLRFGCEKAQAGRYTFR